MNIYYIIITYLTIAISSVPKTPVFKEMLKRSGNLITPAVPDVLKFRTARLMAVTKLMETECPCGHVVTVLLVYKRDYHVEEIEENDLRDNLRGTVS